jgi:hypothetical protein
MKIIIYEVVEKEQNQQRYVTEVIGEKVPLVGHFFRIPDNIQLKYVLYEVKAIVHDVESYCSAYCTAHTHEEFLEKIVQ